MSCVVSSCQTGCGPPSMIERTPQLPATIEGALRFHVKRSRLPSDDTFNANAGEDAWLVVLVRGNLEKKSATTARISPTAMTIYIRLVGSPLAAVVVRIGCPWGFCNSWARASM